MDVFFTETSHVTLACGSSSLGKAAVTLVRSEVKSAHVLILRFILYIFYFNQSQFIR